MTETHPPRVTAEASRLFLNWREALALKRRRGTDLDYWDEQRAYDKLIDFVEAHDLNYTEYDPRDA